MKYRKKTTVVEAEQWDGIQPLDGVTVEPSPGMKLLRAVFTSKGRKVYLKTGDWLVRDQDGKLSRCRAEVFEDTYESAETPLTTQETMRAE
jgi:hypothetical protein